MGRPSKAKKYYEVVVLLTFDQIKAIRDLDNTSITFSHNLIKWWLNEHIDQLTAEQAEEILEDSEGISIYYSKYSPMPAARIQSKSKTEYP